MFTKYNKNDKNALN